MIRELNRLNPHFRVLALSATPGSDSKAVQQVVSNLHVSHIEIRTEESLDVQPYTHRRTKETIVCPLGPAILHIQKQFCTHVLSHYLVRLVRLKAFYERDPMRVFKFQLIQSRTQWRISAGRAMSRKEQAVVEGDYAVLISLYHAFELLYRHGITAFHR